MTERSRHLLEQAIKMTVAERAELAKQLLVSLHGESPENVDAEWSAEVERRALTDESTDRNWADVRAEMAAKHGFK